MVTLLYACSDDYFVIFLIKVQDTLLPPTNVILNEYKHLPLSPNFPLLIQFAVIPETCNHIL